MRISVIVVCAALLVALLLGGAAFAYSMHANAQATSNHPGEPTSFEDSAETRKIPDPIIDPTTIMVASIRPRPRTRCAPSGRLGVVSTATRLVRRLTR